MVWSHNRAGPYVRNRAVPTNPNTARQIAVRENAQTLSIAWFVDLTTDQRANWENYAANVAWTNKLGQAIVLTGQNHFVRSNMPRLQAGMDRIDDAPVIQQIAAPAAALTLSGSEATQLISVAFNTADPWVDEDDAALIVYAGRPINSSRTFYKGPWRYLGVILGDNATPPASPQTFAAPFAFMETQRVWGYARVTRADGRLSEKLFRSFLGAA
jgi:hypothetical protein